MISDKNNISMDNECTLVAMDETKTTLFCAEFAITGAESLRGYQLNIQEQRCIVVNSFEYSGQPTVIYEGNQYAVYRKFPRPDELTELYLEERLGI